LTNLTFEITFFQEIYLKGSEDWSISPFACTSFV
jgi:hypothetical protein